MLVCVIFPKLGSVFSLVPLAYFASAIVNFAQISRSNVFLIDLTDTQNNIDALQDARDVIDESTLDPEPFEYSPVFIFSEQVGAPLPRIISYNTSLMILVAGTNLL